MFTKNLTPTTFSNTNTLLDSKTLMDPNTN